ncbi:MAG: hypothetical protein LC737_02620 [Chloroflexi bacterium]|nr:hypothetical protein [Chloroflexota bacterium]
MSRKAVTLVSALLVICLTVTNVFAGDVHFDGPVVFNLDYGSGATAASTYASLSSSTAGTTSLDLLRASGTLVGLGNADVNVTLVGQGIPTVNCTNQGGNQAPGQNPPKVSASGQQLLNYQQYTKNGRSPFGVSTNAPDVAGLSAVQLGCANNNWTAQVTFVNWTGAVITVTSVKTGAVLLKQNFSCTTTNTTVTCSPTS